MIALGPFDPQTKTRDVAIVDVEKQEFRIIGDVVSWQESGTEHWTARDVKGFYHHDGKYYSPDSGSALEAATALCERLSAGPKVTA